MEELVSKSGLAEEPFDSSKRARQQSSQDVPLGRVEASFVD
jgi:hypothetical protein